jgi:uncharacterized membrane protein YcaP (DUF421 family)
VWFFRSFAIGEPIAIIKDGKFVMENILQKKNKIDILNIVSILHTQGITSFQEVSFAQIEPSGSLTVITERGKYPSLILFKNGEYRVPDLQKIHKDTDWLKQQLDEQGLFEDDVYLIEYWDSKLNFIQRNGEVKRC